MLCRGHLILTSGLGTGHLKIYSIEGGGAGNEDVGYDDVT